MGDSSSHCIPESEFYKIAQKRGKIACFIRHPLTWLKSWWQYKEDYITGDANHRALGRSWRAFSPFDRKCCSRDFNEFIDLVLYHYPAGVVWMFFRSYMLQSNEVYHVEKLKVDIAGFIRRTLCQEIKTDLPETNKSTSTAKYTKKQAEAVMERECKYFPEYDYIPDGIIE
jgi:hypothetical protein